MAILTHDGKVLAEGMVLNMWSAYQQFSEGQDTDFFASYWNGTEIVTHLRGSTRSDSRDQAKIDASVETRLGIAQKLAGPIFESKKLGALGSAKRPEIGRTVRVLKGRKVKPGTEGEVFWKGDKPVFRSYNGAMETRVGLKLESGERVFVPADYCECVDPHEYVAEFLELERSADKDALEKAFTGHEFSDVVVNDKYFGAQKNWVAEERAAKRYIREILDAAYPEFCVDTRGQATEIQKLARA